jgi:tetraacyldisaccharide 4'-kinase
VERALKAAGCDLVDFAPYPDHHPWSEGDLRYLVEQADSFNAGLVTTEKDWIRLPPAWRDKIACWPVVARFDDEAGFRKLLLDSVGVAAVPVSAGTSSPPASRTAHVRVRSRPKAGRPAPR